MSQILDAIDKAEKARKNRNQTSDFDAQKNLYQSLHKPSNPRFYRRFLSVIISALVFAVVVLGVYHYVYVPREIVKPEIVNLASQSTLVTENNVINSDQNVSVINDSGQNKTENDTYQLSELTPIENIPTLTALTPIKNESRKIQNKKPKINESLQNIEKTPPILENNAKELAEKPIKTVKNSEIRPSAIVYHQDEQRRFVFIQGKKYFIGDQLPSEGRLKRILPNAIVVETAAGEMVVQ